ncbi:MAG: rane protein [Bacillales bacterium]|nr:rane protein [Bacillales bacterium]
MNLIIKQRWIVIVAWLAIVIGLFQVAPNMNDLVREKGQIDVPDGYSSKLAAKILDDVKEDEGGDDYSTVALVLHDDKKLNASKITEAERAIRLLEKKQNELGITEIITHFNQKDLEKQLVSKDGKAILVSLKVEWKDREPSEISDALYKTIEDVKVDHHYTSSWMISEAVMKSSEEGLKKTEGITVVFILAVLFIVFRSVFAPFIPLITVGFTYLLSQSIVSILVDKFDFPISNYTQIFLVAILFGIGTDYCILLLSRFKEEMAIRESKIDAILETYKNAGRTVFFSGLAVMIGFASIGFSEFKLYQSAAAVAVGVAILLVALFTIVPFFMATLGQKIFWPSKAKAEHGESKLWGVVGKFALTRPFMALIAVVIVCLPFLANYDGDLSYNQVEEIDDKYPTIQAYNAISKSFKPGESMPTNIVIKNDEEMNSEEYIALAEKISQELKKVDLVDVVRSVTRPTGDPIEQLYVSKQADSLEDGLGKGKDGVDKISDGLSKASIDLAKSEPQLKSAVNGINSLVTGTDKLKTGLVEVNINLSKIENGIRQGAAGSEQIKGGLVQAKAGAVQLLDGYKKLSSGYEDVGANLTTLSTEYNKIGSGLSALNSELNKIQPENFSNIEGSYSGIVNNTDYQKVKGTVLMLQQQLSPLAQGLTELNNGLGNLKSGVSTANEGFKEANAGNQQFINGLEELIVGIDTQLAGLKQLADGQSQIVSNMPLVTNGLTDVNSGQKKLLDGFGGLTGQISKLTSGLDQSAKGLEQVSSGLGSAQDYLSGLSQSETTNSFYLPKEVLESEDFTKALDAYMSKDRKVMTIDVIFDANPYSNEAIDKVKEVKAAVKRATKDTKLENAEVAIGGITSVNYDLNKMSNSDYSRTVVLMLLGISLILVFLFRSLIMPIYIIASLILTFYTSMAVNEVIYVNILGYTGISWAVPFFAFVILVALGVDYSIFLMDRFNEYTELSIAEAMLTSMKKMGTVIISAAVILGGTFAAMMPSGMLSLLQIASILLVGLFLYTLVILPLFIPVMVKNFGEGNWWPFKR